MFDLQNKLQAEIRASIDCNEDAKNEGLKLAKAENSYRCELAKKIAKLQSEKQPATLIRDLARGDKEVADLKEVRDIAEVLYKAANEAQLVHKKTIDVIREEINREWGKSDY